MTDAKLRFTSFLEFANTALPAAFSAQVLGTVPNVRDEDEDHDPEELKKLKLAIMDEPHDMHDAGKSDEDKDAALFAILRSYLGSDEDSEDNEGPHDDHPAEVDHDELRDIDSRLDKDNDGPFEPRHSDDGPSVPDEQDEKHKQLMAAIDDLRQELAAMKSGEAQPQEQEEMSDEEDEQEGTKQEKARQMFSALVNQGKSRQDIIDQFQKQIGVTDSTATSYYQRLAKEAGLTTSGNREMPGQGEPPGLGTASGIDPQLGVAPGNPQDPSAQAMPQEEPESNVTGFEVQGDPNRQGLIRTVKGAHLVYKKKNEEGTFDELWVFSTGNDMKDTLQVRRAILAGTDIPPRALKSENGQQSYTLTSLGNGQILNIKGLPN